MNQNWIFEIKEALLRRESKIIVTRVEDTSDGILKYWMAKTFSKHNKSSSFLNCNFKFGNPHLDSKLVMQKKYFKNIVDFSAMYLIESTGKEIKNVALMYKLLWKSVIEFDSFMIMGSRIFIKVFVRTNWLW